MKYLVTAIVGIVIGAFIGYLLTGAAGVGGPAFRERSDFLQGIKVGTSGQFAVSNAGEVTLGNCGTATWNPGAVTTTTEATTNVTVSGLAAGDMVMASFSLPLETLGIIAEASTTNTAVVHLFATDGTGAAVNLATGTVKVCYFD